MNGRWALIVAGASFASSLTWAPGGFAATPAQAMPVRLTWQNSAPSDCIDPATVESEVEQRLQQRVFFEGAAALELRARFDQVGRYRFVRLALVAPSGVELGTRELVSEREDCTELRVLLPVVIAVLVNPHLQPSEESAREAEAERSEPQVASRQPHLPVKTTTKEATKVERSVERSRVSATALPNRVRCAATADALLGFAPSPISTGASLACSLPIAKVFDFDWGVSYRLPASSDEQLGMTARALAGRAALDHTRGAMATTERVTVTLPAELIEGIDQFERNRSCFIAEAVAHELVRRRREGLLRSLESPHPEAADLAETGLADWGASLPSEDEGLVDVNGGKPVRWVEGQGWIEEPA